MSTKKEVSVDHEEEEEATTELYYEINTNGGDVYLTINAGREAKIKVMSGQAPPPIRPPGG